MTSRYTAYYNKTRRLYYVWDRLVGNEIWLDDCDSMENAQQVANKMNNTESEA